MIKKFKIKFIVTALLSIALLLITILGIVNITNFALVSDDADRVLEMLIDNKGSFKEMTPPNDNQSVDGERRGPIGPNSPETQQSMRYFTYCFNYDDESQQLILKMTSFSKEEIIEWAQSLENKTGGWTREIYRYRTYSDENGYKYVTVIDQGRELLPSYRVLIISVIGVFLGLGVSFVILLFLANKFVEPLQISERQQKKFVADAARELKNPVTILALEEENLKETYGVSKSTQAIDKQIKKLNDLTISLNTLLVYESEELKKEVFNLSEMLNNACSEYKSLFKQKAIDLKFEIDPEIIFNGDSNMIYKMIEELLNNALFFSKTYTNLKLYQENSRIGLLIENDAEKIKDGPLDTIFERFYRGDNSLGKGLGLTIVKEIVTLHKGRVIAYAKDNQFNIKIEL